MSILSDSLVGLCCVGESSPEVDNPTITQQPSSQTTTVGNDAPFDVETDDNDANSYEWESNDGSGWVSTGVLTKLLVITSVTLLLSGTQYRCVVRRISNPLLLVVSLSVTLTVTL